MATFCSFISSKSCENSLLALGSNPDVGSFKNNILGYLANSKAIFSHLFSPPEIPLINSLPTILFLAFSNFNS